MSVRKVNSREPWGVKPSGSRKCTSALRGLAFQGCRGAIGSLYVSLTSPSGLNVSPHTHTKGQAGTWKKQEVERLGSAVSTSLSLLHTTTQHSIKVVPMTGNEHRSSVLTIRLSISEHARCFPTPSIDAQRSKTCHTRHKLHLQGS